MYTCTMGVPVGFNDARYNSSETYRYKSVSLSMAALADDTLPFPSEFNSVVSALAAAQHGVGCARRVQGQILAAQGRTSEAEAAFDEAVATLEKLGSRVELGRAYEQRALMRRTLGQAEAARADLQRALSLFVACGASIDRGRAAHRLS